MRDLAMLFEPIVDIRDVLESFLVDDVTIDDWRKTLVTASERLQELGRAWADGDLTSLSELTEQLAGFGLGADIARTRSAADSAARLLDQVRVPGIPRPEDNDWTF